MKKPSVKDIGNPRLVSVKNARRELIRAIRHDEALVAVEDVYEIAADTYSRESDGAFVRDASESGLRAALLYAYQQWTKRSTRKGR